MINFLAILFMSLSCLGFASKQNDSMVNNQPQVQELNIDREVDYQHKEDSQAFTGVRSNRNIMFLTFNEYFYSTEKFLYFTQRISYMVYGNYDYAFSVDYNNIEYSDGVALTERTITRTFNVYGNPDAFSTKLYAYPQYNQVILNPSFSPYDYAVRTIVINQYNKFNPNFYNLFTITFNTANNNSYTYKFYVYFNPTTTDVNHYNPNLNDVQPLQYPYIVYVGDDNANVGGLAFVMNSSVNEFYNIYNYQTTPEQELFNNGYEAGVESGDASYYDSGYQNGFSAGQTTRSQTDYDAGYNAGIIDAGNTNPYMNSIFSGIFQVGLLPVNVFLEILNFEVFGINVSGLVSGLLTMTIIIIIVRFLFGGKKND